MKELKKELEIDNKEFADDIKKALEQTLLIEIEIADKDKPNLMFEVINTTGKKLLPADLIKNFIFFNSYKYPKNIKKFSKEYSLIEDLITDNLKNTKKKNDINDFFRHVVPILGNLNKTEKSTIFKLQSEKNNKIYYDFRRLFDTKEELIF
ncbi:MAG: hypothetical protein ACRCXQ_02705 [Vagococcus fluvialis]